MKTFLLATLRGKGNIQTPDEPLGRGGEGSVFSLESSDLDFINSEKSVAKIYHQPDTDNKNQKIKTMIMSSPNDDSLAWPIGLIASNDGQFKGYLMKKLDYSSYRPWSTLAHSGERRKDAKEFSLKYALIACRNLGVSLHSVHSLGHCVGDVNESNMFVSSTAGVFLIDLDSAQIKDSKSGQIFPCVVGKPEYTAPELIGRQLRDVERTTKTDIFAYSVAIFQMLTGGAHPSDAIYKGEDDSPSVSEKISQGIYPSLTGKPTGVLYPVPRVANLAIPSVIRKIILNGLSVDPSSRIDLPKIIKLIDSVIQNLVQCDREPLHFFDSRDQQCGACIHSDSGQPDPWSNKNGSRSNSSTFDQISLPGVNFENSDSEPIIKRAPAQIAGSSSSNNNSFTPTANHLAPIYNQNNPNQIIQGNAQTNQSNTQQQQKNYPNKVKGKTVLVNRDGEPVIRPPIMSLMRSNPKLAFHCIGNEIPKIFRPWWPNSRNIPNLLYVSLSAVLALVLSSYWFFIGQQLKEMYEFKFSKQVFFYGFTAASVTASLAVLSLFIAALITFFKEKKKHGSLENYVDFSLLKTLGVFLAIAIVFGPPFVIIVIALLALGLINGLSAIVRENR